MKKRPQLALRDFFPEVKVKHLDHSIPKTMSEYMGDPELQDAVTQIIQNSRQASQAVLSGSVKSGANPPVIATAMQMGIIIGVGLALELLNEKENSDNSEEFSPKNQTVQ
jgi:hypothetical protein